MKTESRWKASPCQRRNDISVRDKTDLMMIKRGLISGPSFSLTTPTVPPPGLRLPESAPSSRIGAGSGWRQSRSAAILRMHVIPLVVGISPWHRPSNQQPQATAKSGQCNASCNGRRISCSKRMSNHRGSKRSYCSPMLATAIASDCTPISMNRSPISSGHSCANSCRDAQRANLSLTLWARENSMAEDFESPRASSSHGLKPNP